VAVLVTVVAVDLISPLVTPNPGCLGGLQIRNHKLKQY
jgi:hypothetical protein